MEQIPQHAEQPKPYITVLGWSGPNPVVQTPPEAADDMEIIDLFEEQEGRILYVYLSGRRSLAVASTDGRVKQRLSIQAGNIKEPTWGPFMK